MSGETTERIQLVEFLRLHKDYISVAWGIMTHIDEGLFRAVERQYIRTVQDAPDPRTKAGLAQMGIAAFWAMTLQPRATAKHATAEEWAAGLSASLGRLDLRTPPQPDPVLEQMRARLAGVTV